MNAWRKIVLSIALLCFTGLAQAGQQCGELPATPEDAGRAARLAALVRDQLEQSQLSIALVGRIGLDLSEFGLRYTHLGVAWRDHPRGKWFTFHLLNKCGTGQSELIEQALEDFYRVKLHQYEALIAAPSFPLQLKLQRAFFSPLASQLHEREYNMIAHPFSTKYQNSNQWILEVAATALAPPGSIKSRQEAQDWLRGNGYAGSDIPIANTRRSAARLFSPHVRFLDHSEQEYEKGRYSVVSVDSVLRFLERVDPGLVLKTVRPEQPRL